MSPTLQKQFESYPPQLMLDELKKMFEKPQAVEIYDLLDALHSYKQASRRSESAHMSLNKDFGDFVRNFNMHYVGKTVTELHTLLIDNEKGLKDKAPPPQVLTIQKDWENKPKPQANKKDKSKGKTHKDQTCHHSHVARHWKRNCPLYLEELRKNKDKAEYGAVALESTVRILNMVSTKKVDKTPYEIWHGKAPNLSYLKVWGCEAYVKHDSADKLHQRSVKCIFVGYPKETMGYYFYFPHENKVIVARYGNFFERDLISQKFSGRDNDLKMIIEIPVEPESLGSPPELIPVCRSERTTRAPNHLCLNIEVFKSEVELKLGKKIKALRFDGGGEYLSQEFKDYLSKNGIVQHLTSPYTPQQNGVSERRNRTLLDMVQSMFNLTTLPLSFWDYALESAVRILNMVPTKKRSVKCIFVGYPKETMGYYFYFSPENKVIVARNTRAPNRLCLNIEVEDDEVGDLGEPANYKATMLDPDKVIWQGAMDDEMNSMKVIKVWIVVDLPPNAKVVRNKWLYKKKTDMDGKVHTYKARLVAKGYTQTYGIDYEETFSHVTDIRAIRILMAITAYYDYEIWQMDVKTAFLNGRLDEDIYMEQPEGYVDPKYPNRVCKLQRSIYSLKQASRQWNKRLDEEIKKFRFIQNRDEPCVYRKASGSDVVFLKQHSNHGKQHSKT
nr:hypothetical protein [Tanacetum cinerariifolium]